MTAVEYCVYIHFQTSTKKRVQRTLFPNVLKKVFIKVLVHKHATAEHRSPLTIFHYTTL